MGHFINSQELTASLIHLSTTTTTTPSPPYALINKFDDDELVLDNINNRSLGFDNNDYNNGSSSNYTNMEQFCIGSTLNIPLYSFIIAGLATGLICAFGIIGNILSTIVLIKTQLSASINLLLLGLTACDTIVIFYSLLAFVLPPFFGYLNICLWYTRTMYPLIAPFLLPVGHIGRTGSFYFTVALTIERYIVVCWPLSAKVWCTSRRATYLTILVIIFTIAYTMTKWFEIESIEIVQQASGTEFNVTNTDNNNNANTTMNNEGVFICYALRLTSLATSSLYQLLYNLFYLLVMAILPFCTLVVLNLLIYREIKWSNVTRQIITRSQAQITENSIAIMLLFVILIFFICALPATTLHILEMFSILSHNRLLIDFSFFLVTANSCLNFGIYYICGQKFRDNFIMLWNQYVSCCPIKNSKGLISSHNSTINTSKSMRTECELI